MQIFFLLQQPLRINRVEPDDGWASTLGDGEWTCVIDWDRLVSVVPSQSCGSVNVFRSSFGQALVWSASDMNQWWGETQQRRPSVCTRCLSGRLLSQRNQWFPSSSPREPLSFYRPPPQQRLEPVPLPQSAVIKNALTRIKTSLDIISCNYKDAIILFHQGKLVKHAISETSDLIDVNGWEGKGHPGREGQRIVNSPRSAFCPGRSFLKNWKSRFRDPEMDAATKTLQAKPALV